MLHLIIFLDIYDKMLKRFNLIPETDFWLTDIYDADHFRKLCWGKGEIAHFEQELLFQQVLFLLSIKSLLPKFLKNSKSDA